MSVRGAGLYMISEMTRRRSSAARPQRFVGVGRGAATADGGGRRQVAELDQGRLGGIMAAHGKSQVDCGGHGNDGAAQLHQLWPS